MPRKIQGVNKNAFFQEAAKTAAGSIDWKTVYPINNCLVEKSDVKIMSQANTKIIDNINVTA